jgi:TrmH family RNA methyltransferase
MLRPEAGLRELRGERPVSFAGGPVNLGNILIVLVRAENPANIGQVARAMKNFGLSRLALVDCAPHQVQEAYSLGWNAKEILDQALVFSLLEEALRECALVVGFTRRSGHARGEPRSFLEILPQVMEMAAGHPTALLFGNEKNGLSNQELKSCHLAAVLPTNSEHASLNLSHAAAIASFLIFNQTPQSALNFRKPERYYATQAELADLRADFRRVLEALDYEDSELNDLLTRTLNNLDRLFKKAGLERREFHMFKAFLSRVEQRMEKNAEAEL